LQTGKLVIFVAALFCCFLSRFAKSYAMDWKEHFSHQHFEEKINRNRASRNEVSQSL